MYYDENRYVLASIRTSDPGANVGRYLRSERASEHPSVSRL
jgi:hypothetical protein